MSKINVLNTNGFLAKQLRTGSPLNERCAFHC